MPGPGRITLGGMTLAGAEPLRLALRSFDSSSVISLEALYREESLELPASLRRSPGQQEIICRT